MDRDEAAARLARAKERYERTAEAVRGRWEGNDPWPEFRAAYDALLEAERDDARARGEECALPCEGVPGWDTGAPLPHVLGDGGRVYLWYLLDQPDPAWDGTYARMRSAADPAPVPVVLLTFRWCTSVRFGAPNDEVLHGHPLHGRGLRAYGAHVVRGSRWVAELEKINSVHAGYDPASWRTRKHYLFCFHDNTFECVADGFTAEVLRASFADVLATVAARMLAR